MRPGDHPDFFRVAPPPGTSRESTIRLDREGRFWHDGALVENVALDRAMRTWISVHPDDGRTILTNGYDWCYFTADDAPMFVDAIAVDGDRVTLALFDGTKEPLDPSSMRVGDDGVVRAKVKGGKMEARFTRHAQLELMPLLVDERTIAIGGRRYELKTGR